jgi:hypothetical protein
LRGSIVIIVINNVNEFVRWSLKTGVLVLLCVDVIKCCFVEQQQKRKSSPVTVMEGNKIQRYEALV